MNYELIQIMTSNDTEVTTLNKEAREALDFQTGVQIHSTVRQRIPLSQPEFDTKGQHKQVAAFEPHTQPCRA